MPGPRCDAVCLIAATKKPGGVSVTPGFDAKPTGQGLGSQAQKGPEPLDVRALAEVAASTQNLKVLDAVRPAF